MSKWNDRAFAMAPRRKRPRRVAKKIDAILDAIAYGDAEELAEISSRAAPALQAVLDEIIEERATPAAAERGAS